MYPSLREAVDSLHPGIRHMVQYHMGWIDAAGKPDTRGGKAVRPAFAVLSAEAAGADASVAIPGAVAIELIHNFSLLHDDIMDQDRERRHRTTVWALYGVPAGIISGDAVMVLALDVLRRRPEPAAQEAWRRLLVDTAGMIAGQVEDLAFEDRPHATWDECVAMEEQKTGALLSCSACMGAILAGAPPTVVDGLAGFGRHVGLAFQAIDDLLGIWGSPQVTGKPTSSDLRQSKKSLPICGALEERWARSRRTRGPPGRLPPAGARRDRTRPGSAPDRVERRTRAHRDIRDRSSSRGPRDPGRPSHRPGGTRRVRGPGEVPGFA